MRSDAEENTIAGQHARPSVVERHLQRFRRHKTARPHDQFGASSCSSADAVLFRGQPCRVCVCERPPCRSVNASSRPFRPLTRKCDGAGGSPILPKAGFKFRRYSRMSALRAKADLRHSAGNEVHIEVSHCFQASSLGDTPQGKISPLGLRKNAVTRPCS